MSDIGVFRALYPNLQLIPDQILRNYHIADEMDAWQLHRLYEVIGLEIIEKSALRQMERWPGEPLFVSSLRKRYKHRLPRDFYKSGPEEWGVYLLVVLDHSIAKIGMSSNVPRRAFNLSGNNPYQTDTAKIRFDLDNSFVITGFKSKRGAADVENKIKEKTVNTSVLPPEWTSCYNGITEWRLFDRHMIDRFIEASERDNGLKIITVSSMSVQMPMLDLLA